MYDVGFRNAALKLYNHFRNMKKVANALDIGIGTVWRWIHNGITPVQRKKTPFSEVLLAFVKLTIEKTNHISQIELQQKIKESLGMSISRQCVSKL